METKPSAYEWPVFNAGSRACLGQQWAKSELLIGTKELLGRYEFDIAPGTGERKSQRGMTMKMVGGLPVRVRMRRGGGNEVNKGPRYD